MADYKAPLGKTVAMIVNLAFSIILAFVRKITHVPSRQIIQGLFEKSQEAVKALSDANPDDDAQMLAIANGLFNEGNFYEGTRASLFANINKIPDANPVKTVLLLGADQTYQFADLLTDEVKDNGTQAKQAMADWLKTEDGVKFVTSLFDIVLDKDTADVIAAIIIEAIQGVIGPDQQGLLDRLQALKMARKAKAEAQAMA